MEHFAMNKFAVDYNYLEKEIYKPKYFRYKDVKDRLVKVAYNVVKFREADEDIDGLWEIQATDDGEVIVAKYEENTSKVAEASFKESNWKTVSDHNKENLYIFYKDEVIKKIASTELNINKDEIQYVCNDLSRRLASDNNFRSLLLSELSNIEKMQLFSKFPELAQ